MKNEKELFDKIIQDKLSDLETPFSIPDWDRMEELLDEEEAAAAEFDRKAADRLRRVEPPYDPGTWDLMARRIDHAFSIRHWLHRNHVPELALMVLFGFTLIQYINWGALEGREEAAFSKPPPIRVPEMVKEVKDMPLQPAEQEIPEQIVSEERPLQKQASAAPPVHSADIGQTGAFAEETPVSAAATQPPRVAAGEISQRLSAIGFSPEENIPNLEAYARGSALAAIGAFQAIVRKPPRLYLSGFTGSDYTFVHSPADEVFQTESRWEDSIGYVAGLSVFLEGRKWGLQTGLNYSRVSYRPEVPVQVYGTFDYLIVETFRGIDYQFLKVPVLARRSLLPARSGWDLYAMGGFEACFLLDGKYAIHREEIVSTRSSEPEPNAAELSKLNEKTFPEGLLQGGKFRENAYLNVSAGIGIERQISGRFRVFAESVYTRPFFDQQIGPNEDRIHQGSIRVGGKIRIK